MFADDFTLTYAYWRNECVCVKDVLVNISKIGIVVSSNCMKRYVQCSVRIARKSVAKGLTVSSCEVNEKEESELRMALKTVDQINAQK